MVFVQFPVLCSVSGPMPDVFPKTNDCATTAVTAQGRFRVKRTVLVSIKGERTLGNKLSSPAWLEWTVLGEHKRSQRGPLVLSTVPNIAYWGANHWEGVNLLSSCAGTITMQVEFLHFLIGWFWFSFRSCVLSQDPCRMFFQRPMTVPRLLWLSHSDWKSTSTVSKSDVHRMCASRSAMRISCCSISAKVRQNIVDALKNFQCLVCVFSVCVCLGFACECLCVSVWESV